MMDITVNGERRSLDGPGSLIDLLEQMEMADVRGVAVCINGEIVSRGDWPRISLNPQDELEIVRATMGG